MMTSSNALRGVNLGGWLLLEKWMTPTLFEGTDAVDEYTFMQTDGVAQKLDRHRRTFIREADFKWLVAHGIEAVRIPFGYWIFDGDDPYLAGAKYLDWAVEMAEKYKLKVLLDLHGVKGSQNGKDHSGRIGRSVWFRRRDYRRQTIGVLVQLAERYRKYDCIWGIELMNEPKLGLFHITLRRFYNRAYEALTKAAHPGTRIVFHDAFTPRLMSGAVLGSPSFPVLMDVHWYQFGSIFHKFQTIRGYFKKLSRRKKVLQYLQYRQPIVVGEWSVVLTRELLANASYEREQELFKRHAALQLDVYEHAKAWFYWTYKTEGRGIWHFRSQIEDGVIKLTPRLLQ